MDVKTVNVLLIEDNPADARLIAEMLGTAREGQFSVEQARTLATGAMHCWRGDIDIILLDLMLLESRGINTLKKIMSEMSDIPVIVMTGLDDEKTATEAVKEGAQDYIIKGKVDENLLVRAIHYAIERKKIEGQLRENEERAKAISDSSMDAIIVIDRKGKISYFNGAAEKTFGYRQDEIRGKKLHDVLVSDLAKKEYNKKLPQFEKTGQCPVMGKLTEVTGTRKDGSRFPAEVSISSFQIKGEWHSVGVIRDITKRKRAIEELQKLSRAVEQSPASVVITDREGTIEYVNPKFTRLTGYSFEEAVNKNPRVLKSGEHNTAFYRDLWDTILAGDEWRGEFHNKKKNGELYWEFASISPVKNEKGEIRHFIAVKEDITERKEMDKKLQEAVITDELTGLLNRRGFLTLAEQQRKLAARRKNNLSLLYIDLDNMKPINDQFGHKSGDQALVDTAQILKKTFRESDIIARIGGDEFAVLIPDSSGSRSEKIIAMHLEENLQLHNEEADRPYDLAFSIGMEHYDPEAPCSIEEFLAGADKMMYENKKHKVEDKALKSLQSGHNEKRLFRRYKTGGTYRAILGSSGRSRVKNISLGGICLETSNPLAVNSIHEVRIITPEHDEFKSTGKVVRSVSPPAPGGKNKGPAYVETGIEFDQRGKRLNTFLEKIITNLKK